MARCSRCDEAIQHIKYFNAILERFLGWYAYDFDSLAEQLLLTHSNAWDSCVIAFRNS